MQDSSNGNFPIWWDESDRVTFDVKKKTSRSRAALDRVDRANSKRKDYVAPPGQYMYAVPRTIDGGAMPTFEEWVKQESEKKG